MPVYRLTPLNGTEQDPHWRASSMRPYCLWVHAADEGDARLQVAKATAVAHDPGGPETDAPWNDADLVACEYDDSKNLAAGIIYVCRSAMNIPQANNRYPQA
jgi:hypothetical protein